MTSVALLFPIDWVLTCTEAYEATVAALKEHYNVLPVHNSLLHSDEGTGLIACMNLGSAEHVTESFNQMMDAVTQADVAVYMPGMAVEGEGYTPDATEAFFTGLAYANGKRLIIYTDNSEYELPVSYVFACANYYAVGTADLVATITDIMNDEDYNANNKGEN